MSDVFLRVAFAAFLSVSLLAQTDPPGLGDAPAPIRGARVLNNASGVECSWERHQGKVVVLEFFGTWCGPCVAGMPKVNALVGSLDPEHYQWWLLANQPVDVLERFLREHEVVPPVVVDASGATTAAFSPGQYPLAVVIGPDGRVAARLHPDQLTVERLAEIRSGARIRSPYIRPKVWGDTRWDAKIGADSLAADAVTQVLLQRSTADLPRHVVDADRGRIVADGLRLAGLVALAYDTRENLVDLVGLHDLRRYRVSVRSADGNLATARTMLQELLARSFGASADVAVQLQPRLILERIPGSTKTPPLDDFEGPGGGKWTDAGFVDMRAVDMSALARLVASQGLSEPSRMSLDRTGLTGSYRIQMQYDPKDAASLHRALAGIGLRVERRRIGSRRVCFTRRGE